MDIKKLSVQLVALDAALSSLERTVDLRAQTQRFRNILTSSDLDYVTASCVGAVKKIHAELKITLDE